jgi:hypothetical protein
MAEVARAGEQWIYIGTFNASTFVGIMRRLFKSELDVQVEDHIRLRVIPRIGNLGVRVIRVSTSAPPGVTAETVGVVLIMVLDKDWDSEELRSAIDSSFAAEGIAPRSTVIRPIREGAKDTSTAISPELARSLTRYERTSTLKPKDKDKGEIPWLWIGIGLLVLLIATG